MEKIPQQIISQMRNTLTGMDLAPEKKSKASHLLDAIEAKGGMAPKETEELGKIMAAEEKEITGGLKLSLLAKKTALNFVQKTDRIWTNYLKSLKK